MEQDTKSNKSEMAADVSALKKSSTHETDTQRFADIDFLDRAKGREPAKTKNISLDEWEGKLTETCFNYPRPERADLGIFYERICKNCSNENLILVNAPEQGRRAAELTFELAWEVATSQEKRTLIIDCDMRDSQLSKIFKLDKEAGISNLIARTHVAEDVVRRTNLKNIYLTQCGTAKVNPINALMSSEFLRFVDQMISRFDFVLLNSPPYNGFVDTFILAKFVRPTFVMTLPPNPDKRSYENILDELDVLDLSVLRLIDGR